MEILSLRRLSIVRFNNNAPASKEGPRVNQEISAQKVRLVGADGEMVGVVSRSEALQRATEAGLDLVEVSPNADPPVCKILDYGKYKYELQKKKAEAKKNQKVIEVKEIQLRPGIHENDLQIKLRAMHRFLGEGNKVKISMRFRGRELAHQEIGMAVLKRVEADLELVAKIDSPPKLEGKQVIMIVSPAGPLTKEEMAKREEMLKRAEPAKSIEEIKMEAVVKAAGVAAPAEPAKAPDEGKE